ncbi:DUF2726 domain-containing protein [Clostridium sp. AWRP]|nr:DUF2726 domain-containing protein [Clostridium sp. AWRP]
MNENEQLVLIKGEDKTEEVKYCSYDELTGKYNVNFKNSAKTYSYVYLSVDWQKAEQIIHISDDIAVYEGDIPLWGLDKVIYFRSKIKLFYKNGYKSLYDMYDIRIEKSALEDKKNNNCFEYLKEIANEIKMPKGEGEVESSFLGSLYEKLKFVNPHSVLADYLNPHEIKDTKINKNAIFPFGFNLSQKEATEKALCNKLSVIEGPPGTGKTQTILNILANIILQGKTAAVVSNNNSATQNVVDKLKIYDIEFIAAYLGKSDNKKEFFKNQTGVYPDFASWKENYEKLEKIKGSIESDQANILKLLEVQVELAKLKEEYSQIELEAKRFKEEANNYKIDKSLKFIGRINADKLRDLIFEYEIKDIQSSFFIKIRNLLKYRITSFKFYRNNKETIVNELRNAYYGLKVKELIESIATYEKQLNNHSFDSLIDEYTNNSMAILKDTLANRFKGNKSRKLFGINSFKANYKDFIKDYPVVLSTTHSLRTCIPSEYLFDYVIIDESSQVDLAAGALALSCAKNAVIVGDLKQLPNIITREVREKCDDILKRYYELDQGYSYADNSLLSSIISLYKDIPKTLLKEHYRCNPKIIEFCNKKFYNDELIIMTKESEDCPIMVKKTSEGNHARCRRNQRQVDIIKQEILPSFNKDEKSIGIISPYRDQINLLQKEIKDEYVKIDTIHKFQGQENDIIILSTVANEVNDFIDDPNLINVAVSRAKKKFILVTNNDCDDNKDSNIADLIRYIKYSNGEVSISKVSSVFDMLYKCNAQKMNRYLKGHSNNSEFNSENIVNSLLDNILKDYNSIGKVMHYPLNLIIKDRSLLDDREKEFVSCPCSHNDFIIFNKMDKTPILAIEVDGTAYHEDNLKQLERDEIKDEILKKYNIQCLRLPTDGSEEERKIRDILDSILA